MKQVLLATAFSICALAAAAQTLGVQSGDHDGFTRLVIPIGAERSWDLEQQAEDRWELTVYPTVTGFDTTDVFRLIQRDRLAELEGEEALTLRLACPCEVSSFRHQDRFVVIDIADPDPAAEPFASDEDPLDEDRQRSAASLPDLASLLGAPDRLPDLEAMAMPEEAVAIEDVEPSEVGAPNSRLAEAAEIMAEQLARAAASGLLDASLDQPMSFADPVTRPAPSEQAPSSETLPETLSDTDQPIDPEEEDTSMDVPEIESAAEREISELPIRTQTALDPAIADARPLTPSHAEGSCRSIPLDAGDWAESTSFEQGLGELRLTLYDERDLLIAESAEALGLYYLYFGFGAEARHWLLQTSDPSDDLLNIASLVDGAETAPFEQTTSPADCSQGELLWRYIAGAISVDLNTDDIAAIQRAYSELPSQLRDLMGPRLARALFEDGYSVAARNVRDILDRGGRVPAGTLRLLDLDLGITPDNSVAETRNALTDMLMSNGSDPVETMAQALAFDRSVGILPGPERLTAAEALLREVGDSPDSNALWHEILLGHAANGSLDTALNMLGDPAFAGPAREAALTDLITERVAVQDTAGLLVLAYTFGRDWRPQGSAAGRAQVSAVAMLREAGLYEAAQILRDVRRPLILPATEDIERTPPSQLTVAWEEEDWAELAALASGAHGEIAARMAVLSETPEDPTTSPPDLAALNNRVIDSRALRSTIADLLEQPTPQ